MIVQTQRSSYNSSVSFPDLLCCDLACLFVNLIKTAAQLALLQTSTLASQQRETQAKQAGDKSAKQTAAVPIVL
ncbi:hypothetical protein ACLKA6_004881 [Drosophila palustris]